MRIELVAAAASLMMVAVPACAQDRSVASSDITAGNYAKAELTLASEMRADPRRPELLLNMAAVYIGTGRFQAARDAYQAVLEQQDVEMDLATDNSMGSHQIARAGLRYMQTAQQTASR